MPAKGAPRFDDLKIHLAVLGQEREIDARVRVGPTRPAELLPLAHRVADEIADAGTRAAKEEGRTVSCRAGCGACCRQVVPIAPVEALAIAKLVKSMPGNRREAVRRRFAAAVRKLEELGLVDAGAPPGRTQLIAAPSGGDSAWMVASTRYFRAGIPCPFLESESCSIYADRPVVCREFLATTPPERCQDMPEGGVETTPRPVYLSEVLSEISAAIADVEPLAMPLVLALEWAEAHGSLLEVEVDGEALVRDFIERTTDSV